jgi:hypothetical protein
MIFIKEGAYLYVAKKFEATKPNSSSKDKEFNTFKHKSMWEIMSIKDFQITLKNIRTRKLSIMTSEEFGVAIVIHHFFAILTKEELEKLHGMD